MVKISLDFVTNSSSTSFIISSKKVDDKEDFLSKMGIESPSLLSSFFENLYNAVKTVMRAVPEGIDIILFLKNEGVLVDEEDEIEILRRYKNGEVIYYGRLEDHGEYGDSAEAYYALQSFVVIEDDFFFASKESLY